MYIEAQCRTNLDYYQCPVTKFVALPRITESVRVLNAKGEQTTLRVCQITHAVKIDGTPFIIVELNV
jgi:hypothetical protein